MCHTHVRTHTYTYRERERESHNTCAGVLQGQRLTRQMSGAVHTQSGKTGTDRPDKCVKAARSTQIVKTQVLDSTVKRNIKFHIPVKREISSDSSLLDVTVVCILQDGQVAHRPCVCRLHR